MIEFLKSYSPLFLIVLLAGMFYKDVYPKLPKVKLEKTSRSNRASSSSRAHYDGASKGCKSCDDYGGRRARPASHTSSAKKTEEAPSRAATVTDLRYKRMGDDVGYKYCLCCKKGEKKAKKCKASIENKLKCRKREIRDSYHQYIFMKAFNDRTSGCK